MRRIYLNLLRTLSLHWLGKTGVVLTTSSFFTFLILELLSFAGVYTNAYMGLITYLLFPTIFFIGLFCIPLGWLKSLKITGKTSNELIFKQFDNTDSQPKLFGSKVFLFLLGLTAINVVFMLGASTRTLHFMESAEFCGTACHNVMSPEYIAYKDSPHANIPCIECHVGEGVGALIETKLSGARMMFKAITNTYSRPIPTPVHNLRPANATCEKCHWPEKKYNTRLKQIVHYKNDENNTPQYSTLNLKIDNKNGGIHWHINPENKIKYASKNNDRDIMVWVDQLQDDGSWVRYSNKKEKENSEFDYHIKEMDCVDCHNRVAHIFESPEKSIEKLITNGKISSTLPFIRKEAIDAVTGFTHDNNLGFTQIENHLQSYYNNKYPQFSENKLDQAIGEIQKVYSKNIHSQMNIDWNTYPNHLGHQETDGCFRCHNNNMVNQNGIHIRSDCTMCHSILANDSDKPFQYLYPVKENNPEKDMHEYLRDEFISSF
jgi:hypothetical protein